MLIIKKNLIVDQAEPCQVFEVKATDPSFATDVKAWANLTGNKLYEVNESGGVVTAILKKQSERAEQGGVTHPAVFI